MMTWMIIIAIVILITIFVFAVKFNNYTLKYDADLESVVKKIFIGEPQEKITKYLKILKSFHICQEQHLPLALDLIDSHGGIPTVDMEKFRQFVEQKYHGTIEYAVKDIFKGEPQVKIVKYIKILRSFHIYQEQHLPLALDLIDSRDEIPTVDKGKFRQYVSKNYRDEYDEYLESEREARKERQKEKDQKHEIKMKKMGIIEDSMKHKKEEKMMILSKKKEIQDAIKDENDKCALQKYFAGSSSKIARNMDLLSRHDSRLNHLENNIDACNALLMSISKDERLQIKDT